MINNEIYDLIDLKFITLYCGTISVLLELNTEKDIIYILDTDTLKLLGVVDMGTKEIIYRDVDYLEDTLKECIDTYINKFFKESI